MSVNDDLNWSGPDDLDRAVAEVLAPAEWWAPTAPHAPMVAHLLAEDPIDRTAAAACGEYRRSWQRRNDYAVPSAFSLCPKCARIAGQ